MQDIKFRCRDIKTHEIVAYEVIQNNTWMVSHDENFEKWSRGTWWVDCIREQFTLLKDKNGVEIFAGDILQYEIVHNGEKKIEIHSVLLEYNDPTRTPGFRINDNERYCPMRLDVNTIYITGMEIIGNIHENPDLISPNK